MYVIGQPSRIDHIGLHMSHMSVCVNLFILFVVMKRNHMMRFAILVFLIVDRIFMGPRGVKGMKGVLGPSGHQGQPGLKGGILLLTKNCKYFKLKTISGNATAGDKGEVCYNCMGKGLPGPPGPRGPPGVPGNSVHQSFHMIIFNI